MTSAASEIATAISDNDVTVGSGPKYRDSDRSLFIRANDPFAGRISWRDDPIAGMAMPLVQPFCFRMSRRGAR